MNYCIDISISMLLTSTITISLLLVATLPPSLSQPPLSNYSLCSQQPYKCGEHLDPGVYYPFWGENRPPYCGGGDQFNLTCEHDSYSDYASIQMGSQKFTVEEINTHAYTMRLVPAPLEPNICSMQFNFSLSPVFMYNQTLRNITIFSDCPSGVSSGGHSITCNNSRVFYYVGGEDEVLKHHQELKKCGRRIQVPAEALPWPYHGDKVDAALGIGKGFQVRYTLSEECMRCLGSKGACGSDDKHQFTCYCRDGSSALHCHQSNRQAWKRTAIIGVISAAIAGLLICITVCCAKCESSIWQEIFWLTTKSNQDIEAFLKNQGALTLKRYKFSDVKKMTYSFRDKLGQGGFGAVYKGKLLNGCIVAVKILNPSKGNGEEFINEVASISRTSHVNIVTLLGFCLEGRRKALIYEFMSNGSLEKFINKKEFESTPSLSWDNLHQIALGVARGLEYLHRGCNTRILHFDIKPHNILLDENFYPKISNFVLAKLCLRKESIISISDARGTIGYLAPEVWNRHFGGVSHKSDIYSFGMMLLEIVGATKNINAEANHSDEMYFPDWIYRRLEQGIDLGHDGEVAIEEKEVIKRMAVVGLWCTQMFPNDRPTMSRVVNMLEGNMNSLDIPPRPISSSPIRSIVESSTTINWIEIDAMHGL